MVEFWLLVSKLEWRKVGFEFDPAKGDCANDALPDYEKLEQNALASLTN